MSEPVTGPFTPEQTLTPKTLSDRSLDSTGVGGGVVVAAPAISPGLQRGKFTILKEHARGGLGKVSVAVDARLKRQVALKEIRPDRTDVPALRQRFITEAEITGMLEHPGVVPIYAFEEDERGQPYYAMRFIQGRTLGEAIRAFHGEAPADEPAGSSRRAGGTEGADGTGGDKPRRSSDFASLAFRELLQRFVSVCQTMAYAHSKGIIHRDLKPANVMLGDYGETLVLDWGLAKRVTGAEQTDVPARTSLSADDSGPVSAEALTEAGAILGTPAYASPEQACGEELGSASDVYSLGAMLHELLTGRSPYQGKTGADVLAHVRAGPPPAPVQMLWSVPKPLDAICRRAMARNASNRYATATDLAKDLDRWLADEPVSAYGDPWTTRLRRWGRRHRTLVSSGVVTLLLGVAALTGFALLVQQHAVAVEAQRNQLAEAHDREHRLADLGQRTIEAMTDAKALGVLRTANELTDAQKGWLRQAANYYGDVTAQVAADETGRMRQAVAYSRMAYLQYELGEKPAAEQAYRRALDMQEKLAADFPSVPEYRQELATSHNNLGLLQKALGQLPAAEQAFRRALDIQVKLADDFPTEPQYRLDLARSHNNLGLLQKALGQLPAAEQAYRQALDIFQKLADDFPTEPQYRQELGRSHNNLGSLLADLGQEPAAEQACRRGLEIRDKLVADFPIMLAYRQDLAISLNNLGALLYQLGQGPAAEQAYRRALEIQEKLAADFPTVPQYRLDLARTHNNLGNPRRAQGQWPAAEQAFRRALDIYEKLAADFPTEPQYRRELAGNHNNLGNVLADLGQWPAAEQAYRRSLDIKEKLAADFPTVPADRLHLAGSYVNFGKLLLDQGQGEASLAWYAKAIVVLELLVQQEPRLVRERLFLRNAYWGRAAALDTLARHGDAVKDWDRALALNGVPTDGPSIRRSRAYSMVRAGEHTEAVAEADALAEAKDVDSGTLYNLARVCALAAAVKPPSPQLSPTIEEGEKYATRAVELLRRAVAKGYKDVERVKKERDLDGLREREDFRKLLTELEAAPPATDTPIKSQ